MRFYLIAGERSGDLHGSNLVRELAAKYELAEFRGVGGKRMQKENVVISRPASDLSFMGFWEVVRHLRTIWNAMRFLKKDIARFRPDVIILIDFPGFNLRMAKWAKKQGFRVVYYITPQVWAWKPERVYKLEAYTDRLITILPFEQAFFADYGIPAHRIAHPIACEISALRSEPPDPRTAAISDKPIVALLPGSRRQEIRHMLPVMSRVAKYFPEYQFVVAGVSEVRADYYEKFISTDWIKIVTDKTYDLLKLARAAVVTSGTATLETALFDVPQVVCYKGSRASFWIARRLVQVNWISLVNLILGRSLVTELIQAGLTETNLKDELEKILPEGARRDDMLAGYRELREALGEGSGPAQAAEIIFELLEE